MSLRKLIKIMPFISILFLITIVIFFLLNFNQINEETLLLGYFIALFILMPLGNANLHNFFYKHLKIRVLNTIDFLLKAIIICNFWLIFNSSEYILFLIYVLFALILTCFVLNLFRYFLFSRILENEEIKQYIDMRDFVENNKLKSKIQILVLKIKIYLIMFYAFIITATAKYSFMSIFFRLILIAISIYLIVNFVLYYINLLNVVNKKIKKEVILCMIIIVLSIFFHVIINYKSKINTFSFIHFLPFSLNLFIFKKLKTISRKYLYD